MSRWKYRPRQVWIGWTVGFAAFALLSFIGGIYWLGVACIVWGSAMRRADAAGVEPKLAAVTGGVYASCGRQLSRSFPDRLSERRAWQ